MRHHTKDKGDLGVFAAQLDLVEKGYRILIPLTEHAPFDLVATDGERFIRVQVKYRASVDGTLRLNLSTCWADRHGTHTLQMNKDEIDVICIYCPDTRRCYYLDPKRFRRTVALRITPALNKMNKGINRAEDFTELPVALRSNRVESTSSDCTASLPVRIRR